MSRTHRRRGPVTALTGRPRQLRRLPVDGYQLIAVTGDGTEFPLRTSYTSQEQAVDDARLLVAAGWARAVVRDGGEDLHHIDPPTPRRP